MVKKYFFKRGNARVSWDNAPEGAWFFAVDKNGYGYWWKRIPAQSDGTWWIDDGNYRLACAVGAECPDWQELLFGPGNATQLVTPEEWAAIRVVLPGARFIEKDENGNVFASCKPMEYCDYEALTEGDVLCLCFLKERLAAIPNRQIIEYPGA